MDMPRPRDKLWTIACECKQSRSSKKGRDLARGQCKSSGTISRALSILLWGFSHSPVNPTHVKAQMKAFLYTGLIIACCGPNRLPLITMISIITIKLTQVSDWRVIDAIAAPW
mgnify:CR=1 FL=1